MYKLTNSNTIRRAEGACIPADPANTDYQQYQEWLAAGNTPEPADPPPNPRPAEILARLAEIDMESIRALRAIQAGRGKLFDTQKLTALEDEAEALRAELPTLWPGQQGIPLRAPVLASPSL
jgi:hypothetical protein